MATDLTRRTLLGAAAAAAILATGAAGAQAVGAGFKIVGVSCSARKGKTTMAGLQACLDAAKEGNPGVEVELIELAGLKINPAVVAGVPLEAGEQDDFPKVQAKLADPRVAGIIIGTPVYFGSMSALCKAFLDRCFVFRKDFGLKNKVGGVLAVGGVRNGGQELTIQQVHAAMLAQDMIVVGCARPAGGATLWNDGKDDISSDEFGLATAKGLGKRVAEVAMRMTK